MAEWLRAFGADPAEAPAVAFAPRHYRDVLDGAMALAKAVGRLPEAFRVVGEGEARLMTLARRLDYNRRVGTVGGRPAPTVVVLDRLDPPRGAGLWVPDLVAHAAGRPLLAGAGRPPREITPKDLAATDPDALAIALPDTRAASALGALHAALETWPPLRAVGEGRAFALDGRLVHHPGPNLVRAVEVLAVALHGDRVGVPIESCELARLG